MWFRPCLQCFTMMCCRWWIMLQKKNAITVICCCGKAKAFLSCKTWHTVISEACHYQMPTDRWPERGTSRLPLGRQSLGIRCQYSSRQLWCRGTPGHSGWQGERKTWGGRVTHIMRFGCERARDVLFCSGTCLRPESLWGYSVDYQYCVYCRD